MSRQIERYEHHGVIVATMSDLRGKHSENCLCYSGCVHFKPKTPENCEIAQSVYQNCVKFNITTPVFECPKFQAA